MTLTGMAAVTAAMGYAYSKIGDWYVYGAKGPTTFDCSGLTTDAWQAAGYAIGAGTSGQLAFGQFIVGQGSYLPWASTIVEFLRGDLLFPGPEHVQLYDGEGWIIEAPATGLKVRRVRQWATSLYAVRRVVPGDPNAPLLWPGTVLSPGVTFYGTGRWQQKMVQLGNLGAHNQTVYDSNTAAATKKFQAGHHLPVTGQVDKATWTAAFG